MDLGSTFAALLGPVEVNQILRVPRNDVSSYEVIQLRLQLLLFAQRHQIIFRIEQVFQFFLTPAWSGEEFAIFAARSAWLNA
jgi:hypothetical protein